MSITDSDMDSVKEQNLNPRGQLLQPPVILEDFNQSENNLPASKTKNKQTNTNKTKMGWKRIILNILYAYKRSILRR